MKDFRIEKDSMGDVKVPSTAYYGAQTQRAFENFPISGIRFSRRFIQALGEIKRAAAEVNRDRKLIDSKIADGIIKAATEVAEGKLDGEFVLDIFQTGSGTSTNMNANEVIANRGLEIIGEERGSKKIHPNDHVNRGQSSNDVIPTAMHVSLLLALENDFLPAFLKLENALTNKAQQFDSIVKIGRTHLQDATPIRLGQVFSGYASQISDSIARTKRAMIPLQELALGGTAVGTGINCPEGFAADVISKISKRIGISLKEATNHFSAQGSKDAIVEASGALKATATGLMKVVNDLRWLSSGPNCGIAEIHLPDLQPGSSIMPGKVNPVILESTMMVCAQVMGNDLTVTVGGQHGNFELNVMMPVMAHGVLQSTQILSTSAENLRVRCVEGIQPNEARCKDNIERSDAMVTALAPKIGYDQAAAISKEARKTGKTVREIAMEKKVLPSDELTKILDPLKMTKPDKK